MARQHTAAHRVVVVPAKRVCMGILRHSIYSFTGHPLPARSLSGCFLATCRLEEVPVARRTLQAAAAGALRCRLGGGTRPAVATAAPGTARSPAPIPQSASENGTHHFPSCHLSDIVPSDIILPPARGAAQPSHILPYAGSFLYSSEDLEGTFVSKWERRARDRGSGRRHGGRRRG